MFSFVSNKKIGEFINEQVICSSYSNLKIAVTVALAFLVSSLPIWGFQTICALALALVLHLNKVVMVAISNISQPPITPIIIYLSYLFGGLLVTNSKRAISFSSGINLQTIKINFYQYFMGSILLSMSLALISGAATYFILQYIIRRESHVRSTNTN